ncbi:MAG: hypothetical protein JSV22_06490 [Bacteroidales bacterium]|nr:MAG: hypothetical protein JSV22_06490 [Bacteroidales bacterium]
MKTDKIDTLKQKGFAFSIIAFPVMLLAGFILHPKIFQMEPLQTTEQLVGRFHNNPLYHIGHLIVTFAVPVIIIVMVGTMNLLQGRGKRIGFWGCVIGVFGAFILAVDKGALCLVLSAFDTIPDDQFSGLIPYLHVIVNKDGLLIILWLLPLLAIGGILQAIGLLREKIIKNWQGILIIIGLLLLNNPDIDLIGSIGACLMCIGYIPWGIREFKN